MAKKKRRIVAVDVGTSSIKIVVVDATRVKSASREVVGAGEGAFAGVAPVAAGYRLQVSGVGEAPSRGLRKGVIIHIEGASESIRNALLQAESMVGGPLSHAVVSVSGAVISSFNSHGMVGIRDGEVRQLDKVRVLEAARAVAIPEDREVVHVVPQGFSVDEEEGIFEPLGMAGVRLESRVHIISCTKNSIENLKRCARSCQLSVEGMVASPIASAAGVLTAEERQLGTLLLDFGGGTCGICVVENGVVTHTAVIPIGGNHITNDIAAGLQTPIVAAEQIKVRYGTVNRADVATGETLEVSTAGGRSPRVVSRSVLSQVIEPRVREVFELVKASLAEQGISLHRLASGVVIVGGSARLQGLTTFAEEVFGCPVRCGCPVTRGMQPGTLARRQEFEGLTDLIAGPEYAAAAGLVRHCLDPLSQDEGQLKRNVLRSSFRKVRAWLAEQI